MKKYTVRFAHLKEFPEFKIGDKISKFQKIGTMGNTGQSEYNHLHIDLVEGFVDKIIRLKEIGYNKKYKPNIKQLNYFIDGLLFKVPIAITTYFYDPEYKELFNKDHPAYDVVPADRHKTYNHYNFYWNRIKVKNPTVLKVGYDENGYGNYILIGFKA